MSLNLKEKLMPSQVKNISLSFVGFKILDLSFKLNPDYEGWENESKNWQGTTFEHDIEFEIAHNFNEQEKALRVLLSISAIPKDAPFSISLKGIGLFLVKELPDPQQLDLFARVNCAAIVFPYIRETIADVTRRAGFPTMHLQPVNFAKMYNDFVESQTKEKSKTKRK